MSYSSRLLKILILVVVGSYFAYALFWLAKSLPLIVEISLSRGIYEPATGLRFVDSYSTFAAYLMEYSGLVGLILRVIGASYALLVAIQFLRTNASLFTFKGKISKALFFEGCYYLSLIPAIYFLLGYSALPMVSNFLLSAAILTQILLISLFALALSRKLKQYNLGTYSPALLRMIGLAVMSYVVAQWIIYMLKWSEMTAVDPYLFSAFSIRILGLLNTLIVQSLAVVFAVVGLLRLVRKNGAEKALKWWGLSLVFLSLHITLYVVYVIGVGIPRFIPFGELWLIPLFAVGVYLLLKKPEATHAP